MKTYRFPDVGKDTDRDGIALSSGKKVDARALALNDGVFFSLTLHPTNRPEVPYSDHPVARTPELPHQARKNTHPKQMYRMQPAGRHTGTGRFFPDGRCWQDAGAVRFARWIRVVR